MILAICWAATGQSWLLVETIDRCACPTLLKRSEAWADYCDAERPLELAIKKLLAKQNMSTAKKRKPEMPLAAIGVPRDDAYAAAALEPFPAT